MKLGVFKFWSYRSVPCSVTAFRVSVPGRQGFIALCASNVLEVLRLTKRDVMPVSVVGIEVAVYDHRVAGSVEINYCYKRRKDAPDYEATSVELDYGVGVSRCEARLFEELHKVVKFPGLRRLRMAAFGCLLRGSGRVFVVPYLIIWE